MSQFYEQIEAYLLGELSNEAHRDFEAALQSDPELARLVEQHRVMLQRLESARVRQKVKKSILETKSESAGGFVVSKNVLWAVAASLTVLAAMVWFFTQPNSPDTPQIAVEQPAPLESPKPPVSNPEPDTVETPIMSPAPRNTARQMAMAQAYHATLSPDMIRGVQPPGVPGAKPVLQQALEAYTAQNYRQAANLLRPDSLVANNKNALLLRAGARFKLGRYEQALTDYNLLSYSFEFKHDARWNALLCQLALGQEQQVSVELRKMTSDPDFPFYQKALELQARLKN